MAPDLAQLLQDPARVGDLPPAEARALLLRLAPVVEGLRLRALHAGVSNGQPVAPEPDRLLTPEEAAERLNMTVARVRELCRLRHLPAFKAGRGWRLPERALRAWAEKQLDTRGISLIPSRHGTTDGPPPPPPARAHPVEVRVHPRGERPDGETVGGGDDPGRRASRAADPAARHRGGDTRDHRGG